MATAALVVVDVPASTISYATAGHPPPMLRLSDGTVTLFDDANGTMVGVSSDLPARHVQPRFLLGRGSWCTPTA